MNPCSTSTIVVIIAWIKCRFFSWGWDNKIKKLVGSPGIIIKISMSLIKVERKVRVMNFLLCCKQLIKTNAVNSMKLLFENKDFTHNYTLKMIKFCLIFMQFFVLFVFFAFILFLTFDIFVVAAVAIKFIITSKKKLLLFCIMSAHVHNVSTCGDVFCELLMDLILKEGID